MKKLDLIGQQFGRLLVVSEAGINKSKNSLWHCRCNCGVGSVVRGAHLRSGEVKSCGCLKRQLSAERLTTHRATGTVEYKAYTNAKDRCTNPNHISWPRYGGRGIEFRLPDFREFLAHIGPKPSNKHSLDRILNNGHYEIGNIRWETDEIQNRNKRTNVMLSYMGETLCIAEWGKKFGIHRNTISERLKRGWTVERALGTPVHKKRGA